MREGLASRQSCHVQNGDVVNGGVRSSKTMRDALPGVESGNRKYLLQALRIVRGHVTKSSWLQCCSRYRVIVAVVHREIQMAAELA